jgi:hypothetical protein
MRSMRHVAGVAVVGAAMVLGTVMVDGQGPREGRAALDGYQEVPTLSTTGQGSTRIRISPDQTSVEYTLSYGQLEGTPTQAHIHLGRPAVNGGIIVWLCTTGAVTPPPTIPTPPPCPVPGGTVSGVLTAADVVGPSGQGLPPGAFARLVDALRQEATYVNVHSTRYPPGEIRGQVTFHAHGLPAR